MDNDQIVPRLMMPLSLSYDHRLVDGAAAVRFLNEVIGYLRSPQPPAAGPVEPGRGRLHRNESGTGFLIPPTTESRMRL